MVNTLVPLFEWFKTSTDIYAIAISTVSDFSTIIYASTITFSAGYPSNPYSFGLKTNLSPNTTYYWRVASACAIGSVGAYSPTASFRTGNITGPFISPPSMIAPADGAVVSSSPVTFSWGNVTGATGWQIRFYRTLSDAQADLYFVLVWTNTWYNSWTQYFGTTGTYYWRILAKDARAWGSLSPIRSFTVGGNPRLPIVFVTGWRGLERDWSCSQSDPETSWAEEIGDLRARGFQVYTAILTSSWCYTPQLSANVYVLRDAIQNVKQITGQKKVILIAHSMGGIVSRQYIEHKTIYQNDVDSLFTLGSPHQGIPDNAFNLFVARNATTMGKYTQMQPVMYDLSISGMRLFNTIYKPRADVKYYFISGDAPDTSLYIVGRILKMMNPGHNDVVISTDSGRGEGISGTSINRMTSDEVHSSELGPRDYFVWDNGLSQSYCRYIAPILIGSTPSGCSGRAPSRSATKTLSADSSSSRTSIAYGTVFLGQSVNRTIPIDGGSTLFATSWQTGTVSVNLIDPNNQTIDPAFAVANPSIVTYSVANTLATYNFPNAIPGNWSVVVQGTSVPAEGTSFATFASINSGVNLTGSVDRLWYTPGTTAVISGTLSGTLSNASVLATISHADGIAQTVNLSPLGAGQYQGSYTVPNAPGYTEARLLASGTTAGGAPFERETSVLFQIASNRSALNGIYNDTPEPRLPGSSLYKALLVNVGINSSASGNVGLSADLVDMVGNFVAHSNTLANAPVGASTLTLRFDGADIFASRRNGPYRLTNLLFIDQQNVTLVISEATNVYTTAAYNYLNFAESANYFPFIRK